ncbi:carbon-nitrogen hydrolase family protein [Microbacterium sp. NPDC057659]|uniref:carbon-nitrogen hydrolase family protein n=1 Tax=Microbacterium sp. NPDC057659 TaxID=3346198 RepID=UPI0036733B6C
MTKNSNLKRRVRERSARTGESYAAARRSLVGPDDPAGRRITVAVAQTALDDDPRSAEQLRAAGGRVRRLIAAAASAGAALVLFPEGALTSPTRRGMSVGVDDHDADWSAVDRAVVAEQLSAASAAAAEHRIWAVVGGIRLSEDDDRPANALFVFSDEGVLVDCYEERMLSHTKASHLYRAGTRPVVFDVAGVRFGCTLGMESHYPELFAGYEQAGVDCVLVATTGLSQAPGVFAVEAAGHAATNSYWVAYAAGAGDETSPSGVVAPDGRWAVRGDGSESVVVAELDTAAGRIARDWRRAARTALSAAAEG